MKAWEIRVGELELREVGSVHPREGETVVRVGYAGICGSDLPKLRRPNGFVLPELWRPGHEIVGMDQNGRVVAIDPLVPCGTCARCTDGATHLCFELRRLGWDLPGGLADQVVVPAANAPPLPDGLDRLHAVLADPTAVAIHGLRCNPIGPPGRLAVVGAGTVGLLTALYAHQQGWAVTVVHRDERAPHATVADAVPAVFRSPAALIGETFGVVVDAATGADSVALDFALALDVLRAHASRVANLVTKAGQLADLAAVLGGWSTRGRPPDDWLVSQCVTRSTSFGVWRRAHPHPGVRQRAPRRVRG